MKTKVKEVVQLYADAHDKAKDYLRQADNFAENLAQLITDGEIKVGEAVQLSDGRIVWVVDNFAAKNTVFRPAPVRRFDVSAKQP